MARRRNRRRSGIFNLFSDLIDDVWDFIDDDILDRGRDTEWDLRQAGRNWFDDYDYDDDEPGRPRYYNDDDRYRYRRHSRRRYRDDDLDDLQDAVAKLARKVRQIEYSANNAAAPKATV